MSMSSVLDFLGHMYGSEMYRMADGGWLVTCPCCKTPFTMSDVLVMGIQYYGSNGQARDMLMQEPGAICETCRTDYGSYQGFLRADEITEAARAREDRDGISPMVGAE